MSSVGSSHIATHCIRREVENVAVTAARQNDRVGRVACDLAGEEVSSDDAFGVSIDEDQVEHLVAGMHVDLTRFDLARKGTVSTEEKLLTGLAPRVEGTRNLSTTE